MKVQDTRLVLPPGRCCNATPIAGPSSCRCVAHHRRASPLHTATVIVPPCARRHALPCHPISLCGPVPPITVARRRASPCCAAYRHHASPHLTAARRRPSYTAHHHAPLCRPTSLRCPAKPIASTRRHDSLLRAADRSRAFPRHPSQSCLLMLSHAAVPPRVAPITDLWDLDHLHTCLMENRKKNRKGVYRN